MMLIVNVFKSARKIVNNLLQGSVLKRNTISRGNGHRIVSLDSGHLLEMRTYFLFVIKSMVLEK